MNAMRNAIAETSLFAVARAKFYCPVDTGRLRASITMNYSGSGQVAVAAFVPSKKKGVKDQPERVTTLKEPESLPNTIIAIVGTNVEYAPYLEYGTKRGVQAVGFLGQGIREANTKLPGLVSKWLKRIVIVKG